MDGKVLCDSCGNKFDTMVYEKGQSIGSGLWEFQHLKKIKRRVDMCEYKRMGGEEEERYEK